MVSAEVGFLKDGDIQIGLYTLQEWKDKMEKPPNLFLRLKLNSDHKKASKVPFKFDNVPEGAYGIYAFRDLNGNGKQDWRGIGFSLEPCATYKHTTTAGWNEVKFDVKESIGDILFVLMSPEGTSR